jgi:hypothetical protein
MAFVNNMKGQLYTYIGVRETKDKIHEVEM